MAFLRLADDDWEMAVQVVKAADELQMERRRSELKVMVEALSKTVGAAVAQSIARVFGG